MNNKNLIFPEVHIIGAGGLARDFHACFKNEVTIQGMWDDGVTKGTLVNGIPVLGTLKDFVAQSTSCNFVIMVANPELRKKFAAMLRETTHTGAVVVHSLSRIFNEEKVFLSEGCVVFPGTIITTEVTVGAHTLIHAGCSLHHDTVVGSWCMLMPGSRLTGNVTVGDAVYIGANVALTNGATVGDGEKL